MGSTGTGSFSDYSRRKPTSSDENNGGSSGVDKCEIAVSTELEEIDRCFYFINYSDVPPVGTNILIIFNGVRLAVESVGGEEIGYLPTSYNYLKFCMDDGYEYKGRISSSSNTVPPRITIDIAPSNE